MWMGRNVCNCIGEVSYGEINYSVDLLVHCEHVGMIMNRANIKMASALSIPSVVRV